MFGRIIVSLIGMMVVLGSATGVASGNNEFIVSCEGAESSGGGTLRYQYTLLNNSPTPQQLQLFYVGTNDLAAANYTNWTAPAGFGSVVGTGIPGHSVMFTTQVKTSHGAVPPAGNTQALGVVSWSGNVLVPPGGTVTFGFDHPYDSWDMEWFAEHPVGGNFTVSNPVAPIAGPLGTYTPGWVHGPGQESESAGIEISCEGTESSGGGNTRYQYTLRNPGAGALTLTLFYLGTHDVLPTNYSNWTMPAGFTPWVGPWFTPPYSLMFSSGVKTPHGVVPPTAGAAAPGIISWFGNVVIPGGGTVTFGFDNPRPSWDMEWFAEHPGGASVTGGQSLLPIAGPLGTFTTGWVHGPAPNLDFGDAPDPTFPTLLVNNGARHELGQSVYLGNSVDPDVDGQPTPIADGDDLDGNDDEDGLVFIGPWVQGGSANMQVTVTGGGWLQVWADFNGDGSWAGEKVYDNNLAAGVHNILIPVPAAAALGPTFARFRLSSGGGLSFDGYAQDGEVEDYQVLIEEPPPDSDYGDAPDPTYPTLLANNGARHQLGHPIYLGNSVDTDIDGQPNVTASGDDLDGNDDEDGVTFLAPVQAGQAASLSVSVAGGGVLQVWFDVAADGGWAEPGDLVFNSFLPPGTHNLSLPIPGTAKPGTTYARFRISNAGGLSFDGFAPDGEVEDYIVTVIEPEEESKWLQEPDRSDLGIDVNGSYQFLLADDFPCTQSGPITQIRIWGSWFDDILPDPGNPAFVTFQLSIHSDIPADDSPTGYSMPGDALWLWESVPGSFDIAFETGFLEGWLDPDDPVGFLFPADSTIWEYTFHIPEAEAFYQEGTLEDTLVYWLDVKAIPFDGAARFGWKTSETHWNDDAVWVLAEEPFVGIWNELRYPPNHPLDGESIDLAFEIWGIEDLGVDWGDAVDPTYPTLLASNGARHTIIPGIQLGPTVEADPDGQPHVHAIGDDTDGADDEDGVILPSPMVVGQNHNVTVNVAGGGVLQFWIDYDNDGTWTQPNEAVFNGYLPAGVHNLVVAVPASAQPGITAARVRLSSAGGLSYDGPAPNGEVEDYEISIQNTTGTPESVGPRVFALHQSMPNPFRTSTAIRFDLPDRQMVTLQVFSVDGRLVATLADREYPRGNHSVTWNGRSAAGRPVASGIYLYSLRTESLSATRRMLLLR